jgi:serine/threonine-protein kinase
MLQSPLGHLIHDRYTPIQSLRSDGVGLLASTADTFEAVDNRNNQRVMLKLMSWDPGEDPDLTKIRRQSFVSEASIYLQLELCPYFLAIRDADLNGDQPFVVTDCLGIPPHQGRMLSELIGTDTPCKPEQVIRLGRQMAASLARLHATRAQYRTMVLPHLCHGELQPQSFWLVEDPAEESVVLRDLDIMRLVARSRQQLVEPLAPRYAAPERLDLAPPDPRSDIYSLGLLLYALLTGTIPFATVEPESVQSSPTNSQRWKDIHRTQTLPPLSRWAGLAVPPELEGLVMSCLAPDPIQRPATMQAVEARLAALLAPIPQTTATVPTPLPSPFNSSNASGSISRRAFTRPAHKVRVDPYIGMILEERYRVEKRIGKGGMGSVYLGTDQNLGRQVAIKIMNSSGGSDPENEIKRFKREVDVCASLNSPNIVQISDYGVTERGQPYYVMEYLQGSTLNQALKASGFLPWQRTIQILLQICAGLKEAHDLNIVHRDLKPDNIFLLSGSIGERVKILDFGIAKMVDDQRRTQLTAVGAFLGTLRYAAPEQCGINKPIDARSDIYALGLMIYEMLTGSNPFGIDTQMPGFNPMDWITCHLKRNPQALKHQPDGSLIPEELISLVLQCLAKKPADRVQSITDLERGLRRVLSRYPSAPPFSQPAPQQDPALQTIVERPAQSAPNPQPQPAAVQPQQGSRQETTFNLSGDPHATVVDQNSANLPGSTSEPFGQSITGEPLEVVPSRDPNQTVADQSPSVQDPTRTVVQPPPTQQDPTATVVQVSAQSDHWVEQARQVAASQDPTRTVIQSPLSQQDPTATVVQVSAQSDHWVEQARQVAASQNAPPVARSSNPITASPWNRSEKLPAPAPVPPPREMPQAHPQQGSQPLQTPPSSGEQRPMSGSKPAPKRRTPGCLILIVLAVLIGGGMYGASIFWPTAPWCGRITYLCHGDLTGPPEDN